MAFYELFGLVSFFIRVWPCRYFGEGYQQPWFGGYCIYTSANYGIDNRYTKTFPVDCSFKTWLLSTLGGIRTGLHPQTVFPCSGWLAVHCSVWDTWRDCTSAAPETAGHMQGSSFFSLQEHPEATLTLSLAQTVFCRKHGFDPQSPLCVHIMLSGTVTKVSGDFHEERWAIMSWY